MLIRSRISQYMSNLLISQYIEESDLLISQYIEDNLNYIIEFLCNGVIEVFSNYSYLIEEWPEED